MNEQRSYVHGLVFQVFPMNYLCLRSLTHPSVYRGSSKSTEDTLWGYKCRKALPGVSRLKS